MFGKKKRTIEEQRQTIADLEAKLAALGAENQRLTLRIEDVERRESSIGRAISEATVAADKMIEDAQRKADTMLEQAQTDCDAAKRDAEVLVDDAYRNARDIVREAETESTRRLDETQERINQYAALLQTYDRLMQEQIQIAQDNAKRFAELSSAMHEAVPQILSPEGQLLEPPTPDPAPVESTEAEPEEKPQESGEEKLWTVDEIAGEPEAEKSHVDAIIDEILTASEDAQ